MDLAFDEELPPDPAVLLRSLRGIGYSLEDAVADIVDNGLAAGATRIAITLTDRDTDIVVEILDNGSGLDVDSLRCALRLGAKERDPGLLRRSNDLGRFGLGLKTASFSVAKRLLVATSQESYRGAAVWDLDDVERQGRWQLSRPSEEEESALNRSLPIGAVGTLVRWSKSDRLGPKGAGSRTAALAMALDRLRGHLGMVFHRYLDGLDGEGDPLPRLTISINGQEVRPWNPLVPFYRNAERVEFGEARKAPGVRVEYAVLPPIEMLSPSERVEAAPDGRRMADMQGFYVYRVNRIVTFADWLGLPGHGSGRWNKEQSTQLARVAVDITNTSDDDWGLDVRKSRVSPPDRDRPTLEAVGTEARARSRARIFGRSARTGQGQAQTPAELPVLWSLEAGAPRITRHHPLVESLLNPKHGTTVSAMRAAARGLLRQLENSPALVSLLAEPTDDEDGADASAASTPAAAAAILDEADLADAVDLGSALLRGGAAIDVVIAVLSDDPRIGKRDEILGILRRRLEATG